ncbi:UNKNOWN [Stylonychia lemnae]|uniref:Uncharacterized protein n=1 Tax=Stylonychia lemnae TaxID=5949 RepID=A0A077ZXN4_STYLE|nr:UNKNOWN [Stylonychia lemnae]|eukprot:CDW73992.1 UNKNOWN [Stylonychia lemnae]
MGCTSMKLKHGNNNAPHIVLVEYSPRYEEEAVSAAEKMEYKYPNLFQFEMRREALMSRKLEVSIYFNKNEAIGEPDARVHSKLSILKFPSDDWRSFLSNIDASLRTSKVEVTRAPQLVF